MNNKIKNQSIRLNDIDFYPVFVALTGSRSYGTNSPDSDYDIRGIVIPRDKSYYFGFLKRFEQYEGNFEIDDIIDNECTLFDLRKFIKLAVDCNPNIIELLYTNSGLYTSPIYDELKENANLFLSKKAKHTFSGYAIAQLKRIKNHYEWVHRPPSKPIYLSTEEKNALPIDQLKLFKAKLNNWNKYLEWKKNRNEARQQLEMKYGYDTKHGMHLVRLFRMGIEILEGKGVIVNRPDAEELNTIRNGAWSYDKLIGYANKCEDKLNRLYEFSSLRTNPDRNKIDKLCVNLIEKVLS